jgi:hypothetical protein
VGTQIFLKTGCYSHHGSDFLIESETTALHLHEGGPQSSQGRSTGKAWSCAGLSRNAASIINNTAIQRGLFVCALFFRSRQKINSHFLARHLSAPLQIMEIDGAPGWIY